MDTEQGRATRVLIVADEPVGGMVRFALNHGHFQSLETRTVADAEDGLRSWKPEVVIVDLDLVTDDPRALLRRHAPGAEHVPTIAITRRGDVQAALDAFDEGAYDVIVAPLVPEELVTRVFALIRRVYGRRIKLIAGIAVADLVLDVTTHGVRMKHEAVSLTDAEFAILYLLASQPGRIFTRQEIIDAVFGRDYSPTSNVVDAHVRNLRAKLRNHWRTPRYIQTVAGSGYRMVAQVASAPTVRVPAG